MLIKTTALKSNSFYLSLLLLFLLPGSNLSCRKLDVFEKNVALPAHEWKDTYQPVFHFDIADTNSSYKAYVVVRHSDAYAYQNLYLNLSITYPESDSTLQEKVNIQLADNSRGWYGSGMDDIWEYRFPLNKFPLRLRKGSYSFKLAHIMRDNPLPHILNIGIRVEKTP